MKWIRSLKVTNNNTLSISELLIKPSSASALMITTWILDFGLTILHISLWTLRSWPLMVKQTALFIDSSKVSPLSWIQTNSSGWMLIYIDDGKFRLRFLALSLFFKSNVPYSTMQRTIEHKKPLKVYWTLLDFRLLMIQLYHFHRSFAI